LFVLLAIQLEDLNIPQDHGEQVVEVVGDPTSQLTAEPFPGRKAAAAISSAQPFEASHVLLADWRS
jgi:hypothetical protein